MVPTGWLCAISESSLPQLPDRLPAIARVRQRDGAIRRIGPQDRSIEADQEAHLARHPCLVMLSRSSSIASLITDGKLSSVSSSSAPARQMPES